MMRLIGQQAYVPPNLGAALASFTPGDIIQSPAAPSKEATGALNHVLIDPMMKDIVAIDPGAGIVKACTEAHKADVTLVYTTKDFPIDEISKTMRFAKNDGVAIHHLARGEPLGTIIYDGHEVQVPYHKQIKGEEARMLIGESSVYLGSHGDWASRFDNSRGYEINPYHHAAHRHIENAQAENPGIVIYNKRSGGQMEKFRLFPDYYRYLPQQLYRYHRHAQADVRLTAPYFVAFSEPVVSAMRLPPPALKVATSDVRFMVIRGTFNNMDSGKGDEIYDEEFVYDVPGYDTYYSRFRRIQRVAMERNLKFPFLLHSFEEALRLESDGKGRIWLVSSQHVDPIPIAKQQGDYYLYWLSHPPIGSFVRRFSVMFSVISRHATIDTDKGVVNGIQCVTLTQGERYHMHRQKIPVWEYHPGDHGRKPFVDPLRYYTCNQSETNRKPSLFFYERGEYCTEDCLRCHMDEMGQVREYCKDLHSVSPIYCFDSLYVPMGFDQFSRVPWTDEFVSDYYQGETPLVPLGYEEGVEDD